MQMAGQSNVFFGYPSEPRTSAETIATAVKALNEGGTIHAVSWEDLRVPGRLLIEKVVGAIDASDASAFDITQLNHNVMFELGYAIGSGKAVWLLLDESNEAGARLWREIRILTTIEYSSYINSGHIVAEFWKALPHQQTKSIFDSLEPNLEPANAPTIFTVPSIHPTEADRRLRTRLAEERHRGARVLTLIRLNRVFSRSSGTHSESTRAMRPSSISARKTEKAGQSTMRAARWSPDSRTAWAARSSWLPRLDMTGRSIIRTCYASTTPPLNWSSG